MMDSKEDPSIFVLR